jgi:2-methylcitrate dehydratase PrpD
MTREAAAVGQSSGQATAAVTEFVIGASIDRFPPETIRLAKHFIVDGLGVILAGSTTRGSAVIRDYVRAGGEATEATIVGHEVFRCRAASAALANGAAGHAMDFDDTQLSSTPDRVFGLLTHPTLPPLVAALAVGERLGVTGKRLLEAYLTGFEVECKIADAIHPSHYTNGFHSSGTIGTFGAMAAAAKLLNLNADMFANALAITASMASGIRVNFGTMTKPLHVGRAAQNGVVAAELAVRGFTGGADALDGPWGFFKVLGFRSDVDPARIVGTLGNPHSIISPGTSIKPYPCGVLGHPSMDAMLKLVVEHDIRPEAISAIRLRAGSNILTPLRYPIARTELEAKFCPAFMLSSIAIRRKAGIHEFTDGFVQSGPVQEMMRKVQTILDPEIEAQGFDKIRSTVEIDLVDGRTLRQAADERYRGGPERPFTRDELYAKFTECAELVLGREAIASTLEALDSLERVSDVRELIRTMTAGARLASPALRT